MNRLANSIVRFRYPIIGIWAIVAALAIPRASDVDQVLQVEGRTLRPTESRAVQDAIETVFDRPVAKFIAVAVSGDVPVSDPTYSSLLNNLSDAATRLPFIAEVYSYLNAADVALISDDSTTTFLVATYNADFVDRATALAPEFRDAIHREVDRHRSGGEFEVYVTGGPALDHDVRTVSAQDAKTAERRALIPTAAILILAFGALVAALLPIVIGVLSISCSLAAVAMVAQVYPMSHFVIMIVTMIGLGVGIDYSLLIVTRFREEMNHGLSNRQAAVRTILTAGKAVLTSGLTVLVGFASLLATPIIETRSVGIGGLLVVGVAVLLSTTLLPAGLTLLGRGIDWPKWLARRLAWYHAPAAWERWARWLAHHPWRAVIIGLSIAAIITWPLAFIQIGLPKSGWFPSGTESASGVELLEEIGSRGVLQPIRILLTAPEGQRVVGSSYIRGLKRLSDTISTNPRVARIRGPVDFRPGLSMFGYLGLYGNLDRARENYPEFFNAYVSPDARTTLMDVAIADTVSLNSALGVVEEIRTIAAGGIQGLDSVQIRVGGFFASSLDLQHDLLAGFPSVISFVLIVTAIMLLIAFQSVLVPIKAVAMNCLSVAGAFGLVVLVFQHGVGAGLFGVPGATEAVYVVVPVTVFAVVYGLSMDYEVFLLSRMKEAFRRTRKNDVATMEGISVTASVITSAAAIMIIVFGMFAFSRVFAAKLMGFGLAVAVFLDATLIRMVLVPAFMHIAGRWNWWPGMRGKDLLPRTSQPQPQSELPTP